MRNSTLLRLVDATAATGRLKRRNGDAALTIAFQLLFTAALRRRLLMRRRGASPLRARRRR
jgi:hypothetical protein